MTGASLASVAKGIQVYAPTEQVWAVLANIGAVQDYSPGVVKSYYTSNVREGVGASRHCDLLPTGTVEERIVDWCDGEQYSIEIYEGTEVLYTGVAHFTLERDEVATIVTQIMEYIPTDDLPSAFEGKSMEGLVGKIIRGNLVGLKHFIESSEVVTRGV